MLWGHTLRSPHPSARIRSIEIAEAVASPGVYAVLLADDVPGSRFYGLEFTDQPVLASEVVRYVGEPVALVAAEHPELARRAAEKIVVDYEPLPAVVDMRQALEPDAPQVHPFGNVLHEVRVEHGDPNAEAEVWVEGYYETGMQDQAPLGPEAGMAVPAEDGGIDLFVATQWLHIDRKQLAPCLEPARGQGPAVPGGDRRRVRRARGREHADPRVHARAPHGPPGQDGVRARGVVRRATCIGTRPASGCGPARRAAATS